jgi:hypothetical protein
VATRAEHTPTVIDLLEKEWAVLALSAVADDAVRRWGSGDAVLSGFGTVGALMAHVENRATSPEARDAVFCALGGLAAVDDMAARTLLQLLLPGCKAIVRRYRWASETAEERAAEVVADVYDRIRALPTRTTHRWIAAAVLGGTRKRLLRRAERQGCDLSLEEGSAVDALVAEVAGPTAAAELAEVLGWATAEGHLGSADAELIRLTRLAHVPVAQLCEKSGEDPQVMRRRRLRAEHRLRAAVAAA